MADPGRSHSETLKDYLKLKESLEDSRNFFCFNTENGKRMIIKVEDKKKCIAINHNFRACSFSYESPHTFYDSPLELIESYYEGSSVDLLDIFITLDKEEALSYLMEE